MRRDRNAKLLVVLMTAMLVSCSRGDRGAAPGLQGVAEPSLVPIANPSFESDASGWDNVTVGNSEYFSPVDGDYYATSSGGADYISQETAHIIAAGETYTLKLWARSINARGNTATTTVEARFYYGATTIVSVTRDVNPVRLLGDPRIYPNDDGGNVWLDQGYRMEFADGIFYQLDTADPLLDPWTFLHDRDYDPDMAVAPIITPQGLKGLYSTYYEDAPPFTSEIRFLAASGSPPDYRWSSGDVVLSHYGSEQPWVIDAHLYYDDATGRLWMTWGGGTVYVSEMDPSDGMLLGHPPDPEFDTHPEGTHTAVATWSGDEWTGDNEWFEGPALYRHNGYWYLFASYGDLALNYTIRMGRGSAPTGPFTDKDGIGLTEWDADEREYGNTILLGAEGGQDCPGHPHIWEEDGTTYMGYDYVDEYDGSRIDTFGIRKLYWVDDWPTIWTPITLTFRADDHPEAIGQRLGISLRNVGDSSSTAALDRVSVAVTGGGAPD